MTNDDPPDFPGALDHLRSASGQLRLIGDPAAFNTRDTESSRSLGGPSSPWFDELSSHARCLSVLIEAACAGTLDFVDVIRNIHAIWFEPRWGRKFVDSLGPRFGSKKFFDGVEAERNSKAMNFIKQYIRKHPAAGTEQRVNAQAEAKALYEFLTGEAKPAPSPGSLKESQVNQIVELCLDRRHQGLVRHIPTPDMWELVIRANP